MYMNLKRMANYFFLMICLFLSLSVTAQTQTKPLWVQKGEKSLEKSLQTEAIISRFSTLMEWMSTF